VPLDHADVIDAGDRVIDLRDRVVDVTDGAVDSALAGLGLCGLRDEPSGRRCFRRAGHEGRCAFLRVSERFGRDAGAGALPRPSHDG
jgi:hypothetical protein